MSRTVVAEYDANENVLRLAEPLAGVEDHEKVRVSVEKAEVPRSSVDDDPLTLLASLDAPTADIEQMLSEIEAGRR
jgi:hypothetical protein